MTRRALLTGLALCAVLFAASGVGAEGDIGDGVFTYTAIIQPGTVDTINHISGDVATKVDDSLTFYSKAFRVPVAWTVVKTRLVRIVADTVFDADTIGYAIQSKLAHENDSIWSELAVMTKLKENTLWNLAGGYAGRTLRAYDDADSVRAGDYFRVRLELIAEEDSIRAHDQTGKLPLNAKYGVYFLFKQRGSE